MNKKLWALNLMLLALAVAAGMQLRSRYRAEKAREKAKIHVAVPKVPAPPFTPEPAPTATLPQNYLNVAQKDLFDKSRNPDLPVEAPPPPPPPPPMPALPVYHGVMNFGDGPIVIMSTTANGAHQAIKPGEMIGPFKLLDISRDDLTLEWNGQKVKKAIWELQGRSLPSEDEARNAAAAQAQAAAPPPPPKPAETPREKGPGEATTFGFKTCQLNDSTPFGTVVDGYKKNKVSTPFGDTCVWDPVGK